MRKAILAVVLLSVAAVLAFGQTTDDSWGNLKQLRIGQKIRVVDSSLGRTEGKFLGVSEDALTFQVKDRQVNVPRSEVVLVSRPPSKAKQILLGLLAGALIGMDAWVKADRHARGCWGDYEYEIGCTEEKGLSRRSALVATGVGAGGIGIAAAFVKGQGRVIYVHNPDIITDPAPLELHLPLLPTHVSPLVIGLEPPAQGVLEGGNVFAPVKADERNEALGEKPPGSPQ